MPKEPRSHQIPADSPEYEEAWARDLIDAIGKRKARTVLADYKRFAADKTLSDFDRKVSRKRAKILAKLL